MMRACRSCALWAAGWCVFLVGAPIVIVCSLWLPRARLFRMVRLWCRLMLRALGIRVTLCGQFPPPERGPMVIVAPHVSLFDPLVLGSILPYAVAGVELETHFRWPLYGTIIRRLGHIPLSHRTPQRTRESLREAERRLAEGHSLVILPEGHRTRTGRRGPFGLWAFRLAAGAGVPVLPLAFEGGWERHHVGCWHIDPGAWKVHVLPRIHPVGADRAAAESLKVAVEEALDSIS